MDPLFIYYLVNQHPSDFILNQWCSTQALGLWVKVGGREGGRLKPKRKGREGDREWENTERERRERERKRGGALWDGVRKHERRKEGFCRERRRGEEERGGWEEERGRVSVWVRSSRPSTWQRDTDFSIQTCLFPRRRQQTWGLWWVRWPCRPSKGGRPGVREYTHKHKHVHMPQTHIHKRVFLSWTHACTHIDNETFNSVSLLYLPHTHTQSLQYKYSAHVRELKMKD